MLLQVSSHLLMVTMQFLVANEEAFKEKYVNKNILERLIATCARKVRSQKVVNLSKFTFQVDMSYLKSAGGDNKVIPKLAKLYTQGEASDRYILILEGRAKVTIGQV